MSAPARILIRFAFTVLLVWAMNAYLPGYFFVTGEWSGLITVAALITLLNLLVRPLLNILSFPFKILAHLLTLILVNALFLWLVMQIADMFDRAVTSLTVGGGVVGWIVVSVLLGTANWILKEALHAKNGAREA